MSKVRICDICKKPLKRGCNTRHYKIKEMPNIRGDTKNTIEVCAYCWCEMKDFVKRKEKEGTNEN